MKLISNIQKRSSKFKNKPKNSNISKLLKTIFKNSKSISKFQKFNQISKNELKNAYNLMLENPYYHYN
jgi:hypothetical protein